MYGCGVERLGDNSAKPTWWRPVAPLGHDLGLIAILSSSATCPTYPGDLFIQAPRSRSSALPTPIHRYRPRSERAKSEKST